MSGNEFIVYALIFAVVVALPISLYVWLVESFGANKIYEALPELTRNASIADKVAMYFKRQMNWRLDREHAFGRGVAEVLWGVVFLMIAFHAYRVWNGDMHIFKNLVDIVLPLSFAWIGFMVFQLAGLIFTSKGKVPVSDLDAIGAIYSLGLVLFFAHGQAFF